MAGKKTAIENLTFRSWPHATISVKRWNGSQVFRFQVRWKHWSKSKLPETDNETAI